MPDDTPAEIERREDAAVIVVLGAAYPALLSVDEVAREVGDQLATTDALARLRGAGLVHELGGFVWPARAAARAKELGDLV